MTLCNSWPKNAKEFKKKFQELPYEACCLMSQLCDEKALGIDFQNGILYLEKGEDLPVLQELIKTKMISPLIDEAGCRIELRGKECCRYIVNPYMFSTENDE